MRRCLFIAILLCTTAVAGPAYRWVDENGQVHYSDRPREGAEVIALPEYRRPTPRPAPQSDQAQPQPEQPTDPERPYSVIEITRPEAQETLWNIGGTLPVSVDLRPRLQPNHRLVVFLDGERQSFNPGSTNFQLPDVFRGMHTIQVSVVDAFDQQIVRSLPVQFMVQQTSIQNPQRSTPPGINPPRPNPSPGPRP